MSLLNCPGEKYSIEPENDTLLYRRKVPGERYPTAPEKNTL
jgi:hypothetical protein